MSESILIAGIGNIFLGDDAFGVEVVNQIARRPWPDSVQIVDFGIRSYDLAFALTEGYDDVILVDACGRGEPPGTVYLLEIDSVQLPRPETLSGHSLDAVSVLQTAQSFGGIRSRIFLVGCEPGRLDAQDGDMRLSEPVRTAIPQAITMIEALVADLSNPKQTPIRGLIPA